MIDLTTYRIVGILSAYSPSLAALGLVNVEHVLRVTIISHLPSGLRLVRCILDVLDVGESV